MIEHKSSKSLDDLNMEKRIEIEEIKEIEIKLEKLKISKIIVNTIISKRYLYHILRHTR